MRAVDLHMTVAFLGRVGERRAREAFESLSPESVERLGIRLGAVMPMGNPRRPSALSALVSGQTSRGGSVEDTMLALRDPLLDAAGAPPDARPARPHVTIARIRRKAGARERQQALEWAEAIDLSPIQLSLDSIALYTGSASGSERAYDLVQRREAEA